MIFVVLTILAVISAVYCCDLPAIFNIPFLINDHDSLMYGIGVSIIAAYIFYVIQIVIPERVRMYKCSNAAYIQLSELEDNMKMIFFMLSGKRYLNECCLDDIRRHLTENNVYETGSTCDVNMREMTMMEALIYYFKRVDKNINDITTYNLMPYAKQQILMDIFNSELKKNIEEMNSDKPGEVVMVKRNAELAETGTRVTQYSYYVNAIVNCAEDYFNLMVKVGKYKMSIYRERENKKEDDVMDKK